MAARFFVKQQQLLRRASAVIRPWPNHQVCRPTFCTYPTNGTPPDHQQNPEPQSPNPENPNESSSSSQIMSFLRRESDPEKLRNVFVGGSADAAFRRNSDAYRIAVRKLYVAGAPAAIEEILEKLLSQSQPCSEGLAIRVMMLYGQASMPDKIISTFERFQDLGIIPSVKSFNALLAALIRAGKPEIALDFATRVEDLGVSADLTTCNTTLNALCQTGDFDSALEFLGLMADKGCGPDTVSYDTIMDSLYRDCKDTSRRESLVNRLCEMASCKVHLFGIQIRKLCKEKRSTEALALWHKMVSEGLQLDTHGMSSLVISLCKEGHFASGKEVFWEMLRLHRRPSGHCYNMVSRCLVESGDIGVALQLFHEMLDKNWIPDSSTVKLILTALLESPDADLEAAQLLLDRISKSLPPNFVHKWETQLRSLPKGNATDACHRLTNLF